MTSRMEEEINYSTVVFKNEGTAPKENKEDPTIYSEVKPKEAATAVPNGEAAACCHSHLLAACLGIVCFLLVASISAIVYISVVMNEQKANLSDLTAQHQQLKRETKELNWTLSVILKFDTFPVNDYCPDKRCQPCLKDWIQFQEKCYLFYNNGAPWKSWQNSQTYCRNTAADLVVIDSLHEQEFISNHTKTYYDKYHGYWLGLYETTAKDWVWVDGRNDTLGYWISENHGDSGLCGLMIPERNLTASWDTADCIMQNKFICESDVLIRSN